VRLLLRPRLTYNAGSAPRVKTTISCALLFLLWTLSLNAQSGGAKSSSRQQRPGILVTTPSPPPTQPEGFIPDSSSSPGTAEPTKKDIFDDLKVVPGATPSPKNGDLDPWEQQQPAGTGTAGANDSEVTAVVFVLIFIVLLFVAIAVAAQKRTEPKSNAAEKSSDQQKTTTSTSKPRRRRAIVAITLLLLIASWIYPPWVHYRRGAGYQKPQVANGWFYVFDSEQGEPANIRSQLVMQIDLGRLVLIDLIILAGGTMLVLASVRKPEPR
jgi:preprotein translocase subunit SecG